MDAVRKIKKCVLIFCRVLHWIYKHTISPLLGPRCRFFPNCSDYALESIEEHGLIVGGLHAIKRVCCCHPWHPGGLDPVVRKVVKEVDMNLSKQS